ncbi:MAG: sigma factor-like helix-turn-helix DNA-binding protein [Burkholderiales bacterium]|nr:sigma factor-like helix-turn-helix DNA-binding protein [Burkholderiales bacterium]
MKRALRRLPPEQREVLLLVALKDGYGEAARTLGIPIGTVMSRLSRAREKLRAMLGGLPAGARLQRWNDPMSGEPQKDETLRALSQALHQLYDPVLAEPLPERLRIAGVRGRWRSLGRAAALVALGAALGALAAWQIRGERAQPPASSDASAFARRAAIAHAVYSPRCAIRSRWAPTKRAHLVAWLSSGSVAPVRAKLEDVGAQPGRGPTAAGRRRAGRGFMYQCKQGTRITLYVRTDGRDHGETAFRYQSEGKVGVFYWIDRRFGYALASGDIPRERLLSVAEAVYRQLNPE